nr:hypothetical protein BaRGS_025153 [Batillaria attramentaria]
MATFSPTANGDHIVHLMPDDNGVAKVDDDRTDDGKDEARHEGRFTWTSKREYILAAVGYCVGLGNIWRFPYLCQRNGGGAFLIPFLLALVVCGLPLFLLEAAIGQFMGRSSVHIWSVCPLFKGCGIGSNLVSLACFWYYNTIMAWALYYLVSSCQSVLPWSRCDGWWNTADCTDLSLDGDASQLSGNVSLAGYNGHVVWYLVVTLAVTLLVEFLALIKGVKSTGKVVYVTAVLPYIILTVLLVRGATLPGAVDGIIFYLKPDFNKLKDPLVWVEAALQVFYSLGPAWGGIVTMASYNKFHNNCLRDAISLTFVCEGTSIFGGFAIFSVLGYMAHQSGVPIEKVVSSGPGLAYIVYPEAISLMPLPQLWAVLFFVMIFTIAIDSQLTVAETILTTLCDLFPRFLHRYRIPFTAVFCALFLPLGLTCITQGGVYVFQLMDWFIATFIPLICFIECIAIAWIYGADYFGEDIQMMIGRKPPMIFKLLWCFITPFCLLTLTICTWVRYTTPTYGDYEYGAGGVAFGWCVAILTFLPAPVLVVYQLYKSEGTLLQSRLSIPGFHDDTTKKRFGARSFKCSAPALWNALPPSLKSSTSTESFRSHLKTYLFSKF